MWPGTCYCVTAVAATAGGLVERYVSNFTYRQPHKSPGLLDLQHRRASLVTLGASAPCTLLTCRCYTPGKLDPLPLLRSVTHLSLHRKTNETTMAQQTIV